MDASDLISFDPTVITITRHTKVANAGGYAWVETAKAPITVRIYFYNTRNQREYQLPDGEIKRAEYGLLAESDADIVVGHDSYDTFDHGGRTYRVVGVRLYDDANVPEMIQADCVML